MLSLIHHDQIQQIYRMDREIRDKRSRVLHALCRIQCIENFHSHQRKCRSISEASLLIGIDGEKVLRWTAPNARLTTQSELR